MKTEAPFVPSHFYPAATAVAGRSTAFGKAGFSLTEIIVVIAIIGVLSAVAVLGFMSPVQGAQRGVAMNTLETMNAAIHSFNQGNYEMIVTPKANNSEEELWILRTLQYRDPTFPSPGSPYMRVDWNPPSSSDTKEYRLQWSGRLFMLLAPGQAGTGLLISRSGANVGQPYVHPSNFTMAGK